MRPLLILLIVNPFLLFAQELATAFPESIPITEDVVELKQRNFNRGFLPSGWKSLYQYQNGRLIRQRNYFRGELRLDETYEYTEFPNSLEIKNIYTDKEDYSLTINYFNDQRQLIKSEMFFDQDTINPQWVCHNFKYDSVSQQVTFERTNFYSNSRQRSECYELKFTNNRLLNRLTFDSCNVITKKESIEFRNNRTVFRTIDHMDPEVVILGARSEEGIQRFLYRIDKRGNWTKRYFISSSGMRFLEIKNKIKYQAHNNR